MHNEFTAIIERDGDWFIAYCPEIPGANGQGHSLEECRANLADAISLVLADRLEDALRGISETAIREIVSI
jgi:predicted RNase H-like HicB family nuclease